MVVVVIAGGFPCVCLGVVRWFELVVGLRGHGFVLLLCRLFGLRRVC